MSGVSQVLQATEIRQDRVARKRSQYADRLHRPDPDAEEPRPACQQAEIAYDGEYREVAPGTHPTWGLCQNPECFGPDGGGSHIWDGAVADRPVRIQAFHFAIAAAIYGTTPFVRQDVFDELAVGESRSNSVWRGLQDARATGWIEWDESDQEYRQGPLAAALRGGESA